MSYRGCCRTWCTADGDVAGRAVAEDDGRRESVDGEGSRGRRRAEGGRARLAHLRSRARRHDRPQRSHVQLRNVRRPTAPEVSATQLRRAEYVINVTSHYIRAIYNGLSLID